MARLRRALVAEDGFTLIEMVVAITVAALILTGGAAVLAGSLKSIVATRADSQAAELISERIEQLRAVDYAAVAMVSTDLSGDTDIGGTAIDPTFDPDGTGPLVAEDIVTVSGGVVNPHVTTATRNDQKYTMATYVTTPPTDTEVSSANYKRITVRATWSSGGLTHTRQSSTFVTLTRRGLPLPNYQVTAAAGVNTPIVVNAGAKLELPFDVVNRGARDAFNLTVSGIPALGSSFSLYEDTGTSRTYASGVDPAADDADLDGTPDTGEMETDRTLPMLAVTTVPAGTTPGSYVFTLTATSSGQPTATGATRTAQFDVTIVNDGSCSSCTYNALYLRNEYPACATAPCSTTTKTNMPMEPYAPTAGSLPNFDTESDSVAGRSVAWASSTPAWNSTTASTMANWRYTVGKDTVLNGDLILDVYVASMSGSPVTLRTYVNRSTNGSGTTQFLASATGIVTSASYELIRVRVPIANVTIANNRFIEVKVVIEDASVGAQSGIELGYDAAPYPSIVWLPVV